MRVMHHPSHQLRRQVERGKTATGQNGRPSLATFATFWEFEKFWSHKFKVF